MNVRKTSILVPLLVLGLLAAQFSSCEKYVLPDIQLGQDTLFFSAASGSQTLHIATNVITTANPAENWISADPQWFDESSTISIKVAANPDSTSRTGLIPIKSETILKTLVVIQDGLE